MAAIGTPAMPGSVPRGVAGCAEAPTGVGAVPAGKGVAAAGPTTRGVPGIPPGRPGIAAAPLPAPDPEVTVTVPPGVCDEAGGAGAGVGGSGTVLGSSRRVSGVAGSAGAGVAAGLLVSPRGGVWAPTWGAIPVKAQQAMRQKNGTFTWSLSEWRGGWLPVRGPGVSPPIWVWRRAVLPWRSSGSWRRA